MEVSWVEKQATNESGVTKAVPFFRVEDIDRSARFYTDGLGFEMKHKWMPEGRLQWCWLDFGGASLMLQEMLPDQARLLKDTLGSGVSICFMCGDALAVYNEARSRGIEAKRPFVGNGLWVTTILDPDGYVLEFESPTDTPEESVYEGPGA